jgi:outer membrane murein-binding lipoprotein Lpp
VIAAKHKAHIIENVKKGVEFLTEQISMKKLELNKKIEYYEMWERRFRDKKQAVNDKARGANSRLPILSIRL